MIRSQLRPFSVAVQPLARTLLPAARGLSRTVPPLTGSLGVLNKLFDTLAYQPRGREQGYLFWAGWLAHIADSLTSAQDANGPVVQGLLLGTCPELNFYENNLEQNNVAAGVILSLLRPFAVSQIPGFNSKHIYGNPCPSTR